MILKSKDTRTEDIQELNRLLTLNISSKQRSLVERELKYLMSGNSGESNSAYYLDFRFKESKNWAVIHDLRIEHKGLVAQIDHLLINRYMEIHVLETKNYFYGIKINENGEFLFYNGKGTTGVESPIEQNKRHIDVLRKVIEDRNYAPTRLCVSIPITYKNYVLVAPSAKIDRPTNSRFDTSMVIKADAYSSHIEKEVENWSVASTLVTATKVIGSDTLEEFARKILRLHKPGKYNYAGKFGIDETAIKSISDQPPATKTKESVKPTATKSCDNCGVEVEEKVAYFCRMNKVKFDGKLLCRSCQQPAKSTEPIIESGREISTCESCNAAIDSKVVFFCRMNKKKFDSKILCRDCQLKHTI